MPQTKTFEPPSGEAAVALERLRTALSAFREVDPKITSSSMQAFLAVALNPGLGPTEYAAMVGTIQPIMSRLLIDLGPRPETGLGLVDRATHETSLNKQRYFLTPTGKKLRDKLVFYVNPETMADT